MSVFAAELKELLKCKAYFFFFFNFLHLLICFKN